MALTLAGDHFPSGPAASSLIIIGRGYRCWQERMTADRTGTLLFQPEVYTGRMEGMTAGQGTTQCLGIKDILTHCAVIRHLIMRYRRITEAGTGQWRYLLNVNQRHTRPTGGTRIQVLTGCHDTIKEVYQIWYDSRSCILCAKHTNQRSHRRKQATIIGASAQPSSRQGNAVHH